MEKTREKFRLLSIYIVIEVVVFDKVIFINLGFCKYFSLTLKWFILITSFM